MADEHDPNAPGWAAPGDNAPPGAAAPPPLPPPPAYTAPPPPPTGFTPPADQAPAFGASPPPPPPPPGYAGYPGYPTAAPATVGLGQVRSTHGLAITIAVLAGLVAVASLVAVILSLGLWSLYEDGVLTPGDVRDARDASDAFDAGLGFIVSAAMPLAIVWIVWQLRLIANHRAMGHRPGMTPGSAIWGWLIPGLNLLTGPISLHQSLSPPKRTWLVVIWALLLAGGVIFVAASFGSAPSERVASTPGDIDRMQQMSAAGAFGAAGLAVAAVLAAVVAWTATTTQRRAFDAATSAATTAPTTTAC